MLFLRRFVKHVLVFLRHVKIIFNRTSSKQIAPSCELQNVTLVVCFSLRYRFESDLTVVLPKIRVKLTQKYNFSRALRDISEISQHHFFHFRPPPGTNSRQF